MRAIQTSKADLINKKYQITIVNILKNQGRRYSNHYIIKFVNFMSIYYAINLDIIYHLSFLAIYILDISIYCKLNYECNRAESSRYKAKLKFDLIKKLED